MSIKISFIKNIAVKYIKNYVLFVNEDLKINGLSKLPLQENSSYISKILRSSTIKKKNFLTINLNSDQKIILIKIKDNQSTLENEKKGADFFKYIQQYSLKDITFLEDNIKSTNSSNKLFLDEFFHGLELKSYEFKKYKSKKSEEFFTINISTKTSLFKLSKSKRFRSLIEGITLTKDLVSEPGNVLHPDEYSKRLLKLKKFGLKVSVLNSKQLKKLGMNALLGVGQGSIRGSYLVIMEWQGNKSSERPLAFVGKGVCFDTGGISLKPAKFMEDMTYDMAGSAVVVGLMKSLALRKAKVNAIGVVGLVENMPGGNAQRPGDIVKSGRRCSIAVLSCAWRDFASSGWHAVK